jgi:hypothetical protein
MGAGSYLGGHSRIFVSDSGTRWEVPDPAEVRPWDASIEVETGRKIGKEIRSFLSMCAVAFRDDQLSDSNPRPPAILIREIQRAGGNKRWIAEDRSRLALFKSFYLKRSKS